VHHRYPCKSPKQSWKNISAPDQEHHLKEKCQHSLDNGSQGEDTELEIIRELLFPGKWGEQG
jgi:hypothetical protein